MTGEVIVRRLAGHEVGNIAVLDVVEQVVGNARHIVLFFEAGVDPALITGPVGAELIQTGSIAGAPILTFALPLEVKPVFQFADEAISLTPAEAELDLLRARNTCLATRNGEDAETVLDWLNYHHTAHDLHGAVILDRAEPGTDKAFINKLTAGLRKRKLPCRVVSCLSAAICPWASLKCLPRHTPFACPKPRGKTAWTPPHPHHGKPLWVR